MLSSINSSAMFTNLFTRLDTSSKGYLQKSDLKSAFSQIASSTSATAAPSRAASSGIDNLFQTLDGNSDDKVTQDEFSSGASNLLQSLMSQLYSAGKPEGAPPPPPPEDGNGPGGADPAGMTQDQLQAMLDQVGNNGDASSKLTSLIQNFDKADSNGDGKVSMQEALAYDRASAAEASTASASSGGGASNSELQVASMIMQLMLAYGSSSQDSTASTLSVLA